MVFYFPSRWSALKVLLALYVLCFTIYISRVESTTYLNHTCPIAAAYTPSSTYRINLNNLLSILSSPNITGNNLFYNATAGNSAPDRVYGLFMCRGDVTIYTCHDCVATAARQIVERCPDRKEAYIWYDECMLRYDNKSIFSVMEEDPAVYMHLNETFTESYVSHVLGDAMDKLVALASSDQSGNGRQLKGFATTETHDLSNNSETLYGLAQCTPDLSGNQCNWCLRAIIGSLTACCRRSKGVIYLLPSCNIRFETYIFYNKTAAPPTISPSTSSSSGSAGGKGRIITIIVVVVVSILLFILGFCFLRRRAKKATGAGVNGNEILIAEGLQHDLNIIEAATNNFSTENKIGEGGFGNVFKGTLPNGQQIAVKRLSITSGQGEQEFKNEVFLVGKLQHRNLVRLVGFCLEREEKILIYEFVPNKSLDYLLFDPEKGQLLNWLLRYKIIGGIAQGILYLHEHSRLRIIHRDLKASNVLLDGDMNPKISDFGMAKTFGVDQSQANTKRIVGTYGYMAPEYAMHGKFSVKSDVFSFGVLILEIISGKKNNSFYQSGESEDLLSYAWKRWKDGTALDLVDPTLRDSAIGNEVIRCIHIGLLCVQEDPNERPTMTTVVLMLNTYSFPLPLPNHPAFFLPSRKEAMLKQLELDGKSKWSANQVSISELYPR